MPQVLNQEEARDIDALDWLLKKAKLFRFGKKAEAEAFVIMNIGNAPERLGVQVPQISSPEMLKAYLLGQGVNVVPKRYPLKEDFWRNGYYIYKDGELKIFISIPLQCAGRVEQGGTIKINGEPEWHVRVAM